jgi:hypothetical protein
MRTILLAGVAALGLSTAATAAVQTSFTPGGASPSTGFTVIDTFDTLAGVTVIGNASRVIVQTGSNAQGAQPGNSSPTGTRYLSVLGGGVAEISFAPNIVGFQFDWGSIDSYNRLTIFSSAGTQVIVPGTASFPNAANGNQFLPGTNGLFNVMGTQGETFSKIRLESINTNSFEIDNLAVKAGGVVPEPATWAMLIAGFGLVGASMRRQRQTLARVSA